VAADLPAAPSAVIIEMIPLLGAAGVGLASLAGVATAHGRRRRMWFPAFLAGALIADVALALGLGA
jgi:hypothetical protein